MGAQTSREALTNVRITILKENYPEDKLSKKDCELILAETAGTFQTTRKEGQSQLRSCRLERGTLMYVCTNQQSGQL
jgi:hypothetical protein